MFIRLKRTLHLNRKINISFLFVVFFLILLTSVAYSASYITYTISGDVEYQTLPGEPLYNVLKSEAQNGTYAREFTGNHLDSVSESGTEKIYHYYASTYNQANSIANRNNVIFGEHCWRMFRTTDTGGVKLMYNGEAVNNQCLNNRSGHVGYNTATNGSGGSLVLSSGSYWYGTSYTNSGNSFSISGITEQKEWNATTGPTLIGKYTCKSTTETATCSPLYLIVGYRVTVL